VKSSGACAFGVLALACSAETLEPRPQSLVYVDTNALLLGSVTRAPELPGAVAIDTLRIDRLDEHGEPLETRELLVAEPRDWPVSFGVVSTEAQHFRLRAFRADNAHASESGPLLPVANLVLDRLVEIPPSNDFARLRVVLDAACFNAPASFERPWSSCVDGRHVAASVRSGVERVTFVPSSLVDSSELGQTTPCAGSAPPGSVCVPGGASVLGDEASALLELGPGESPSPPHVILLEPFFLDVTELTVGRYREIARSRQLVERTPLPTNPSDRDGAYCTFAGPNNPRNDGLPLNCVSYGAARELCQTLGGDLPTDAQWEYAARGRGWGRTFPWGSEAATCCTASLSRPIQANTAVACSGSGLEPVGSHASNPDCAVSDVSRDGVLDLGGSVQEWTLDAYRPYDHACWTRRGVLVEPRCDDPTALARGERGSYFNAGLSSANAVRRSAGSLGSSTGFRCAYPAGAAP
jgi:formylglycine-generating enzyme required for sulfatase activity